jgi:hypothetical protein
VAADVHLVAAAGSPARLIMTCETEAGPVRVTSTGDTPCERAQKKAADPARIEEQLRKTGGTPFAVSHVTMDLGEDVFLPVSVVNALRRDALEKMEQLLGSQVTESQTACKPVGEEVLLQEWQRDASGENLQADNPVLPETAAVQSVPVRAFSVVTRGAEDQDLAVIAEQNEQDAQAEPVLLNNLGWISRLAQAGVQVVAGAGLNVTNAQARRALEELGAQVTAASPEELPQERVRDLMITEYPVTAKTLTDRKGVTYTVEKDPLSRRHYIRRR